MVERGFAMNDAIELDGDRISHWARIWAQSATGCSLVVGMFFMWRRLSGAFDQPIRWPNLIAMAIAMLVGAALVRFCWGRAVGRWVLPALALLLIGAAVSLPSTNGAALIGFWAILICGEVVSLFLGETDLRRSRVLVNESPVDESPDEETIVAAKDDGVAFVAPIPVQDSGFHTEDEVEAEPEGTVVQRLVRSRRDDGVETITGELRTQVDVGGRRERLHVAFCPPFDVEPSVYAEAVEVDESLGNVDVRVAQVLRQGARIDVDLEHTAVESGSVLIALYVGPPEG